jgi:hypothetical protein
MELLLKKERMRLFFHLRKVDGKDLLTVLVNFLKILWKCVTNPNKKDQILFYDYPPNPSPQRRQLFS